MSQFGIDESPAFLDNLNVGGEVFNALVNEKTNQKRIMKNTKLHLAIVVASLVGAVSARATITGVGATITPGNSWDLNWTDTSGGGAIDGFVAEIVAGGATFDSPISLSFSPSWTGTLVNPNLTYATGPANGNDRSVTLSFAGSAADYSGVVVEIFETLNGNVVNGQAWQWLDLPAHKGLVEGTDWEYIDSSLNPVPEASTMIAGALLLLPLGASSLRVLRQRQTA